MRRDLRGDAEDLITAGVIPALARVPQPHRRAALAIAKVFDPALRSDDHVASPIVRRVVTLCILGEHSILELHLDLAEILDIDPVIQPALARRRPDLEPHVRWLKPPRLTGGRQPVLDLTVERERPHRTDRPGEAAAQPVDHVEIVRGLLQQQPVRETTFRMPVAEVVVATVPHKVAGPTGLHFADQAGVDDLLHFADERHVAHVVTEVQPRPALHGLPQHPVATFDRDRHRLLHENSEPPREGRDRVLLVEEVRRGDDHCVEVAREQLSIICRDEGFRTVHRPIPRQCVRPRIAASDHARALAGGMNGGSQADTTSTRADETDQKILH